MEKKETYDRLIKTIEGDQEELVGLCLKVGNILSPRGKERQVGEAVLDWVHETGIEGFFQPITEQSGNVVATLPGKGDGASLILNAHLDAGRELEPEASEAARKIQGAWIENDLIFGKGLINDKAQLCAFMIAARAIKQTGVSLKGDLTITGVAFETGAPSVDEFQGINYPGEGFGTKWLIDRGVTADYALVGETSGFGIVKAECGAAALKIRVRGREVYTPRLVRGTSLTEHPNALVKMAHLVLALEDWAIDYEKRERRDFEGGNISPKAQVSNVRASNSFGGTSSPYCDIHVDVRLHPGRNPQHIKRDVHTLIKKFGFDCDVSVYQYSRGYIAQNAGPLVTAVETAHSYIFGSRPPIPPSAETSMWRDLNVFNEVGIPSVCYGPPRQREAMSGAQDRAMKIADLVAATKVYALTALLICGEESA